MQIVFACDSSEAGHAVKIVRLPKLRCSTVILERNSRDSAMVLYYIFLLDFPWRPVAKMINSVAQVVTNRFTALPTPTRFDNFLSFEEIDKVAALS